MSTRTPSPKGSFIGKGLYDVDVFIQVLEDRFPENLILSHDLLEGCYTRAALVSDVQLYENSPPRYLADVSRRHRWVRGDWQISPVAASRGSRAQIRGVAAQSALGTLALEDLRQPEAQPRAAIAACWCCSVGWFMLSPPWFWTLVVAGI